MSDPRDNLPSNFGTMDFSTIKDEKTREKLEAIQRNANQTERFFTVLWFGMVVFGLAWFGLIIWVAVHFAMKWW